ncbi:DUF1566 domain-containing protein [Polynucleobacter sp. MWH-Mekk-B1]|uniref:DUF1566 domain-containing protein n=1 Tax=Polynucleobacter finlandensis TaxID=1855894 RepID=UPI001C0E73AF|nr:DUF1566 domain-containing protein [Polynucleobacter finlandensis]MBU3543299.1 DUF1566 domain-containing protein [Polynucleobacter finlandensis]
MRGQFKRSGWRKILAAIAAFNFIGLQVLTPAFGVNITSVSVQYANTTPVLVGFALSTGTASVPLGSIAPTVTAPTSASTGIITYSSSVPGVATIDPITRIIRLVAAGTTVLTATQAKIGNYTSATSTVSLTVTAATATVTTQFGLSSASVVFGATAPTIVAPVTSSAGAITYTSATPSTATITTGGVISLVAVGTTVLTATQAANGNYAAGIYTTTLTVTTPFGLSSASVAFGATAPTITAPVTSSAGAITYTSATPGVASITSAGVISVVGVGTTVLTATQAANGNYAAGIYTTTLTVTATTVSTSAISGVTVPVAEAIPATAISGVGYTGTISWSNNPTSFAYSTVYTATVTLTPTAGYTMTGVTANFFNVSGATATNPVNSGVITAVFPSTAALPDGQIQTATATGGTIGTATGWTLSGGGKLTWSRINSTANWTTASSQCTALGAGWRMPTQEELSGLFNTASAIAAATTAGWTLGSTWSSALYSAGYRYVVNLNGGYGYVSNDTFYDFVSCVR